MEIIYGVYDNKYDSYFGFFKTEESAKLEMTIQLERIIKDDFNGIKDIGLEVDHRKTVINGITYLNIHPIVLR